MHGQEVNLVVGTVFLLWHVHQQDDGGEDAKLLGVFSTEEKALAWQAEASLLDGFRDALDGFEIARKVVDERSWDSGYFYAAASDEAVP